MCSKRSSAILRLFLFVSRSDDVTGQGIEQQDDCSVESHVTEMPIDSALDVIS